MIIPGCSVQPPVIYAHHPTGDGTGGY